MRLFKKAPASSRLGISFHPDGIACAWVEISRSAPPFLRHARFIPWRATAESLGLLREALAAEKPVSTSCVAVLDLADYQLLQVEPPEVPESELLSALRWQVRDLLSYPVEEAVLDLFAVPSQQGSRGPSRIAYAVAAPRAVLSRRIALLQDARVQIEALDIPEMALRNIGARLPESKQGVALLYLGEQSGVILLIRDGGIYLARKFGFGLNGFVGAAVADAFPAAEAASGFKDDVSERLVLEVQRSLDFFESTFRMAPIAALRIAPPPGDGGALFAVLQSGLALPCQWLHLKDLMGVAESLPASEQDRCLTAVGAALRDPEGTA